jgi:hypothetical protein
MKGNSHIRVHLLLSSEGWLPPGEILDAGDPSLMIAVLVSLELTAAELLPLCTASFGEVFAEPLEFCCNEEKRTKS